MGMFTPYLNPLVCLPRRGRCPTASCPCGPRR